MRVDAEIAERFRIVAKIGAGGMGEVYRARDTRLGRDVALKVLPAEVASDPDRVRRFEHEARAAAALNHPNILALHDVGEHEGVPYLVTELLEGESLRERIARGPLPVKEAVRIGVQVARGLAAAHSKGIVHRDLKPENLFVTADGAIKILDFGLASLRGEAEGEAPSTESPTETNMTREGAVLGTAGYMAPEQVRGLKVDQRADIFAFGCVLYEMLTGRRAFAGDTPADTLSAILRDAPAGVEAVTDGVSQPLAELVRRCLEKRPENRFSSAHDLALALAASVSDVDPRLASMVAAAQPRPRRRTLLGLAAAVVILVAAAAALWLRNGLGGAATTLDPAKVMVAPFENVTGDPSLGPLAVQAADAVSRGLVELDSVEALPAPRSLAAGDAQGLGAAAREAGAGVFASGSIFSTGDTFELAGRIVDSATGKPIYALEPERGPRGQPGTAVDRVRQRAMTAVLMHMDRLAFLGGVTKPPLYSAVQEFEAGMLLTGGDWAAAVPHLEKASELDPEFWTPQIFLLVCYRVVGEVDKADAVHRRLEEHRDSMGPAYQMYWEHIEAGIAHKPLESLRQIRALVDLAPRDIGYLWHAAASALGNDRPREALKYLSDLDRFDWKGLSTTLKGAEYFGLAATAHHLLGEYEAELEVVQCGLGVYPDASELRRRQLGALAALGRIDEVERVIDETVRIHAASGIAASLLFTAAYELRAHGHAAEAGRVAMRAEEWYVDQRAPPWVGAVGAAAHRVTCLRMAGREEEAHDLARRTYEAHAEDLDARITWALEAARAGDRAPAEAVDRALAAEKDDPAGTCLSRAEIAAQLGDSERAVELLRQSLGQGGDYFFLHLDTDLEPLRGYPPFEELMRPKG